MRNLLGNTIHLAVSTSCSRRTSERDPDPHIHLQRSETAWDRAWIRSVPSLRSGVSSPTCNSIPDFCLRMLYGSSFASIFSGSGQLLPFRADSTWITLYFRVATNRDSPSAGAVVFLQSKFIQKSEFYGILMVHSRIDYENNFEGKPPCFFVSRSTFRIS